MKHRELEFDGIGYVSNLGKSKYWGVSQQASLGIFRGWRVTIGMPGKDKINLQPQFKITETEAAHVAASFYEYPIKTHSISRTVPSKCGNKEFRISEDLKIHVYNNIFGTTENSHSYLPPKGKPKAANTLPYDWNLESIKVLNQITNIAVNVKETEDYWDMVIRIAKAAKKHL